MLFWNSLCHMLKILIMQLKVVKPYSYYKRHKASLFHSQFSTMVVSFRVFKKASPNGKLTVYLGRRDFIDHVTESDPVDGVLLIDKDYLQGKQVRTLEINFVNPLSFLTILINFTFFNITGLCSTCLFIPIWSRR